MKGLGFGAMSAVGVSALAGNVVAQQEPDGREADIQASCNPGIIDYAHLVPPGEDPDNPSGSYADAPDGGMDLVFQLDEDGMPENGSKPIGYQVVLVRDNNQPATKSVEEGRTRGFAGTVHTTPGGETQRREEFSTSGLQTGDGPTRYWTVLTVADYSQLPEGIPLEAAVVPVDITSQ
ncbi:hypothetical protein [Halorussus caseinilyticus]|uniref:Uncharacterized protein n=1 Tax=Halorussus caseinilyticus TaxID=3034025 RepID=A0ABD5WQH9_9EURY|nr:hypothetical protein [Halorussus sp. DT72]